MKDLLNTCIIIGIIIIVFSVVVFGQKTSNAEASSKRTDLIKSDPTVSLLLPKIDNYKYLRRANINNDSLSSRDIIEFTLDNIDKGDYEKKDMKPTKVTCQITRKLDFITDNGKCNIRIIDNDTFTKYQKKYFGSEMEIQFDDIKYHGYYCKNNGKKYYCFMTDYKDYTLRYSSFDSAYEQNGKYHIKEYYLQVDPSDHDKCVKYFGNDYCSNYKGKNDKPVLADDIVKRDGILYEHVFVKDKDNYYLENNFVVMEG